MLQKFTFEFGVDVVDYDSSVTVEAESEEQKELDRKRLAQWNASVDRFVKEHDSKGERKLFEKLLSLMTKSSKADGKT